MTKKRIFWVVVIIVILLVSLKSCFNIEITKKLTAKDVAVKVLENLGILNAKVDQLAADVDTIKVDVRELKNRKGPTTIWRTKTVVVPQTGQPSSEPVYYNTQQSTDQPRSQRNEPQTGTIVSGSATPGPEDLLFCIDLEPTKTSDASKKFLFWELVNNEGYSISNVIPNFTGRSANMLLAPGGSVNGISYDGSMLRMSVAFVESSYAKIMGVPMPSDFRPALRSNKSGWSSRLMSRSGDYFVYRF